MARPLTPWSRLSVRWKLVLLNALVVAIAGVAVLMLVHRVHSADVGTLMHEAENAPTPQMAQSAYDSAVDRQVIPAVIIAVAGALILNLLVVTVALRPLRHVREAARRLAAGDVGARVGTAAGRRRDEVGEVARSFDEMAAGLERLEELRRRSTDDVAHELRTPVHNLLGLIEAMRDGVVPADTATLDRAHREILRLSGLVDDLRRLADAQSARHHLQLDAVLLGRLARDVVRGFEPALAGRGLGGRVLAPDGDIEVIADADRLAQVLRNLIANAVRYARPGTDVLVSLVHSQHAARVEVVDEGEEIPQSVLAHVFERFVRADPSRGRDSGGAGIGLAIVKELVEAHGGHVGADSSSGRVAVWFELPVGVASPAQFVSSFAETSIPRGLPAAGR